MKKRTFTPGPWVAHGTAIHAESGAVGGASLINKNSAANAALIAAAPDLLAALEYMVRAQAQPWDHADRRASKEKALAAIRKATEVESNV